MTCAKQVVYGQRLERCGLTAAITKLSDRMRVRVPPIVRHFALHDTNVGIRPFSKCGMTNPSRGELHRQS